jgi:VanZ family protein
LSAFLCQKSDRLANSFTSDSGCRAPRIWFLSRVLKLRIFLKYWLPALVWMVVIFSASADSSSYQHSSELFEPLLHWLFPKIPQTEVEEIHHLFRKCAHLTEYAILALLVWRAIHQPQKSQAQKWNWRHAGVALAIVFFYAATDEFHQSFVPGRTALFSDVLIDTSGGAAGLLILWSARKIMRRT